MMQTAEVVAFDGRNMSPFDEIEQEINDLYDEAKNWLDGSVAETQEQHDAIEKLMGMLAEAQKRADAQRVLENTPFDEGKAKVQAKYAPLISDTKTVKGKTVRAIAACKAALEPFRIAKARAAEEAARKIREAAEEAERIAQQAFAQTSVADLEEREQAERLALEAANLNKAANRAAKAASTGTGLVTYWQTVVTDPRALAGHYWKNKPAAVDAFFLSLAEADVRNGIHSIPGCEISEQKKARL
jgi:hypothetical protein